MSRIDDLIRELAPRGVPFKMLGDVGEFIRGNGLQKADLTDEGAPAIHYGQVHTYYGTWTRTSKSFTDPALAAKLRRARTGDLIIATTSEDDAAVAKATAWIGDGEVAVSGDAYIYRHTLDPCYVAYFFQSEDFQAQKVKHITGTKVRRISGDALGKVRIPVPLLEVQREIVRILDHFTGLEAELELSLTREAEARRVQHEHYRHALLNACTGTETTIPLGEVVSLQIGFPFKSSRFSSDLADTRLLRGDNIGQGFLHDRAFKRWRREPGDSLHSYELRAGDVVLAMDRPWVAAGLKWVQLTRDDLPALLVQRVARLRANADVLDEHYLASVIASPEFTAHILSRQGGNTVPHISGADISDFRLSLPSRSEQKRIAKAIGELDVCASGLVVALTAEINARRKQYEYYRDKLLTFEEAAA